MADAPLLDALASSQALGMLGDRPIAEVVAHSRRFVDPLADVTGSVVDLGSGGGVPGLVVAWDRPDLRVVLVDRRAKRTDHLRRLVVRLGLQHRVEVRTADVDEIVRTSAGTFDAATARGFGPPMTTARAGLTLVRPGGPVVISEPPVGERWAPADLDALRVTLERQPGVAVLRRSVGS